MLRYLIQRPVAVLMSFTAMVISGLLLIGKVPVSLLPDVDVPQIVIRINYPNTGAGELEQNIIRPIRDNLVSLNHLANIESRSANHMGLLFLTFDYGTRMNLASLDINERLDRLTHSLPRDMDRPQVMRVNTSDIPVIRIQVIPKDGSNYLEVSNLAEKVLKKRLEQIEGVSVVDINGSQHGILTVTPDMRQLQALGLDESVIAEAIRNANRDWGGLSIKKEDLRYFIKLSNTLESIADIEDLPVRTKEGSVLLLRQLAKVRYEPEQPTGYHLYNNRKGLVITVQKQAGSRMNEMVPVLKEAVLQFQKDYPTVDFAITQDQSFLLEAGISNLYQDLAYGGILTIAILFLFLGNWASPILMSISIPLSLVITFIFFYLFRISFNIISLSGLALGIGMLIDNAIVVIDNITRRRKEGLSPTDSSVEGTNEVMAPVISQVLTTVAVYAPLVLLSGLAGALVYDQSIALTISLGVSLLVAFILCPLLYSLFMGKDRPAKNRRTVTEDTIFYQWVAKGYHRMIHHILRYKPVYFGITLLLMPLGWWLAVHIPVSRLPKIEKKESLVWIDWNDPIDASENLRRTQLLQAHIQPSCLLTESEVGIRQFLLQQDNNTIQRSEVYVSCRDEPSKWATDKKLRDWLTAHYPHATSRIQDAPNAFTQLFTTDAPYLEARFKPLEASATGQPYEGLDSILSRIPDPRYRPGEGMVKETGISISLDNEKMALYGVGKNTLENRLQQLFGIFTIAEIKRFGEVKNIRLKTDSGTAAEMLSRSEVPGQNGALYPLSLFLSMQYATQPKFITADKGGEYASITYEETGGNSLSLQDSIRRLAASHGFGVQFRGRYFEERQQIRQLILIFLVVLFLLYFILAVQYENLILPFIVMLTIPLGVTGGMFLLWITGSTLDVMAVIGFIVILGLVVDDPILKVETLNRLEKKYAGMGIPRDDALLEKILHEAGDICLKPLLMVSLTTSIAMVPVLLVGGLGNDLQRPMALVIIGGLTIGTFFTTWFIPLAYWYAAKWINKKKYT